MKWRLQEGQGEAIYEIGVEDNGLLAGLTQEELMVSLNTLRDMAAQLGASITILRERHIDCGNGNRKKAAEVLVRKVCLNEYSILNLQGICTQMETCFIYSLYRLSCCSMFAFFLSLFLIDLF